MFTFELRDEIDRLLALVGPRSYFYEAVDLIGRLFDPVPEYISLILRGGNSQAQGANNLNSHLAGLSSAITPVDLDRFYEARLQIRDRLTSSPTELAATPEVQRLTRQMDSFATLFSSYVKAQNSVNGAALLLAAHELRGRLSSFADALHLIRNQLDDALAPALPEGWDRLSVVITLAPTARVATHPSFGPRSLEAIFRIS